MYLQSHKIFKATIFCTNLAWVYESITMKSNLSCFSFKDFKAHYYRESHYSHITDGKIEAQKVYEICSFQQHLRSSSEKEQYLPLKTSFLSLY